MDEINEEDRVFYVRKQAVWIHVSHGQDASLLPDSM